MPSQKGTHRLKGTMGELTYYKDQDGYKAKEKTTLSKARIQTDPAFARTRENGSEFGRAGKAVKLLRMAFRPLLQNSADGRVTSRLVQRMVKVLQADTTSTRGERTPMKGDSTLLKNFDFNVNSQLSSTFFSAYTATIDRPGGLLTIDIPSFVPMSKLNAPVGATHFKIVSGGAEIDFDNGTFTSDEQVSADQPIDNTAITVNLQNKVTANSTLPLFLVLGIEFSQEINGALYPLKNGGFNSLTLVSVAK